MSERMAMNRFWMAALIFAVFVVVPALGLYGAYLSLRGHLI